LLTRCWPRCPALRPPRRHWQRSPRTRESTPALLPLLRGATPPTTATAATLGAIRRELVDDEYVYRYRTRARSGRERSAFLLCGFVLALSEPARNPVAAFRAFELTAPTGPPALLAEEFDVEQRQLPATCPAFVHALLLESGYGWPSLPASRVPVVLVIRQPASLAPSGSSC